MAFNVSNEDFDEIFSSKSGETEVKSNEIIDKFLDRLKKFLKKHEKHAGMKSMYNWISKGGSISSFYCKSKLVNDVIEAFQREGIPFIVIEGFQGKKGFFIRSKDEEKQNLILKRILNNLSHYCRITSGQEATSYYLEQNNPDKKMMSIGNISKEQLIYIENIANKTLADEVMGVDKMEDGTYLITVNAKIALMGSLYGNGKTFASSIAESFFLYNSNSKRIVKKISDNEIEFRVARANGFLDEENQLQNPVWVVGDELFFVKRTPRGFEFNYVLEANDEPLFELDYRVSFDDEFYEQRLNSALFKITNKKVFYKLSDVIEHFRSRKKRLREMRIHGEKFLMDTIDLIVSEKIKRDPIYIKGNDWMAKFKHYQIETSKVLQGVKDAKIPLGYHKEQIMDLMDIAYRFKINMNVSSLAIDKLRSIEIHDKYSSLKKVKNVEQLVDKYRRIIHDGPEQTHSRSRTDRDERG